MTFATLRPRPSAIRACTISRDLHGFPRLVDEMEAELAEEWADLPLEGAAAYLRRANLRFAILALDGADEGNPAIAETIGAAHKTGCRVILVTHDLATQAMQAVLRLQPDEVLPYPLPVGALRIVARDPVGSVPLGPADDLEPGAIRPGWTPRGRVLGVMGMAGGVGSTTIAMNLAWELAANGRVCFMDLHGGDEQTSYLDRVQILSPLPEAAPRLLEFARGEYDFVVLDLPSAAVEMLAHVDTCLAVMQPDIRSARGARRMAHPKLQPLLNRAPGIGDIAGRRRWTRTAQAMGLTGVLHLPDGGGMVTRANDRGLPLAEAAAHNPMRRAMVRLADMLRT